MVSEYDEGLIQEGRDAAIVESVVKPYVGEQIDRKITHLVSLYRSGDLTGDAAVNAVAEISALRGMIEELESRQHRGYVATERVYDAEEEDNTSVYDE